MSNPIYLWPVEVKILHEAQADDVKAKELENGIYYEYTGSLRALRSRATMIGLEVNMSYSASTANKIYWIFGIYEIGERTRLSKDLMALVDRIEHNLDRPDPTSCEQTISDKPQLYLGDYKKIWLNVRSK